MTAALRLLDEVGLDKLTTRRLAEALEVQSPALYWHFHNKQELLDEMSAAIQSAADFGGPSPGERWQDWMARRARQRRRLLLAHRDGARLVAATSPGAHVLRMFDSELATLVGRGFTAEQALYAIASIGHYVTGFVLEEQADRQPDGDGTTLAELPTLAAALRDNCGLHGDEAFETGLQLLINGTMVMLSSPKV